MKRTALTHRERVMLALDHQETDRIPIAMLCSGFNPPAYVALQEYLARDRGLTVEEYLKPLIDIASIAPTYVGPTLAPGEDIWGVVRKPVSYGSGCYEEISHHPLAGIRSVDELLDYPWPSTDWFDYSSLPESIERTNGDEEYCTIISDGNVFETAWYLRGFERTFMDMLDSPEIADFIMERVTDFYLAHLRRKLEAAPGRIDLMFTADDIGGQHGLLMSLDMWEGKIKPHHVKLNALAHEFGARIVYHSDGSVMEAVPGLIDMGIDVLQALQFDAKGMDPRTLKGRFGDRLCFEGGISIQSTLPFGTPDDVRREVIDRIAVLGSGGGYILGPSHAIQAGTPPENITALFDTASAYRPGQA